MWMYTVVYVRNTVPIKLSSVGGICRPCTDVRIPSAPSCCLKMCHMIYVLCMLCIHTHNACMHLWMHACMHACAQAYLCTHVVHACTLRIHACCMTPHAMYFHACTVCRRACLHGKFKGPAWVWPLRKQRHCKICIKFPNALTQALARWGSGHRKPTHDLNIRNVVSRAIVRIVSFLSQRRAGILIVLSFGREAMPHISERDQKNSYPCTCIFTHCLILEPLGVIHVNSNRMNYVLGCICIYACMHILMCVYIQIQAHIHSHMCMCSNTLMWRDECIRTHMHIYIYMYMHISIYIYIYMYIRMCTYMCICMCICIHAYTHIWISAHVHTWVHEKMPTRVTERSPTLARTPTCNDSPSRGSVAASSFLFASIEIQAWEICIHLCVNRMFEVDG